MVRVNDVRVAATYDQSLSDSDNIEDFTPTSGSTFRYPGVGDLYFCLSTNPEYSRGELRIDPSAGSTFAGLQQVRYRQPLCHADSLAWLISNYEGQVTAYLRTISTTYATYNCELRFEFTLLDTRQDWYEVTWIFTLVEAL